MLATAIGRPALDVAGVGEERITIFVAEVIPHVASTYAVLKLIRVKHILVIVDLDSEFWAAVFGPIWGIVGRMWLNEDDRRISPVTPGSFGPNCEVAVVYQNTKDIRFGLRQHGSKDKTYGQALTADSCVRQSL